MNNHIGEGTCTTAATSAEGESLEVETEALPDAQSTVCPTVTIDNVPEGDWSVTVTFDSADAFGTSESTLVEAP
ncbi:hypothetical protein C7K25_08045 [Gulosibacter molinativorax]|uniref:Uncharacterized protein n=1 Tax=Gulosibacter molinativorax TaxID=256821 RepID=A0ABT7C831_9MICO|nr:hypothetical protein [Gulosibacter molinativorax]